MENKTKNNVEKTKILIGIGILIFAIIGIVLISGCIEEKPKEKPSNCSTITNNFTGCNISCSSDSDCMRTRCGCINKNENCQTELRDNDVTQGVACDIIAGECECVNGKCEFVQNLTNNTNSTNNKMDEIEDAIKKKLYK